MHFSNVLAIARTPSKSEDFSELIVRTVPKNLKVDTRSYGQLIGPYASHGHYRAIIIEIDTPLPAPKRWTSLKKPDRKILAAPFSWLSPSPLH